MVSGTGLFALHEGEELFVTITGDTVTARSADGAEVDASLLDAANAIIDAAYQERVAAVAAQKSAERNQVAAVLSESLAQKLLPDHLYIAQPIVAISPGKTGFAYMIGTITSAEVRRKINALKGKS